MTDSLRPGLGLRAQILVALGAVALVALLSTGALALWAAGDTLREYREANALSLATAAAAAASAALDPEEPLGASANQRAFAQIVRRVGEMSGVRSVAILRPDLGVVAAWPARAAADRDPPIALAVLSGVPPSINYRRSAAGEVELLAYAGIDAKTRVLGAVRVVLEAPPPVPAFFERSGKVLAFLAIVDAALLLGLGYLVLTRLVVRPLRHMQRATRNVSRGDLDQRITASGPREVAALAEAFNQMTASLASQREQLIRTEKLASVGQLAAGVAHEIGNPLAAILGYADLLRLDTEAPDAPGLSPVERRDIVARVKSETQRIHRIIQDLLAYSRPSREDAQPTDAKLVVASAVALLSPQARFRGVTVAIEDAPARWPEVLVSSGRLEQVIVNLLLNGADAMGGAGRITVSCEVGPATVALTVADEGPGVPEDAKRKIFDPFFTTKAPGQGTGLGLSISRAIAESYGGTLELAPTAKGARFVLTLPRADGAPAVRSGTPAPGR